MSDKHKQRSWFFRLYNRVLQRCSNFVFRPVLRTPPVAVNPEAPVVLYSLLDRRNCRAYLLAVKSFLRYHSNARVVVQDDGTLDSACRRELETHVPGIEILGREETVAFLRRHADESLAAVLPDVERGHFFLLFKLMNLVLRFPGQRVILFDSDLLFLREPTLVLDWIRSGTGWCFYGDGGSGLAKTFHEIGFDFRAVDVADFNSGFLGIPNTVTQVELATVLTKILEYDPAVLQHWEAEQSIWAVLFNGFPRPLNLERVQPGYVGSGYWSCARLRKESVLVHFVGSIRFKNLRYVRLAREVMASLRAAPTGESSLRSGLRATLVAAFSLLTAPLWLGCRLQAVLTGGESFFAACSEFLSLFPGRWGIYLRRGFYRRTLDEYATDASIGFGTLLAHPQVRIGQGVSIGPRCTLGRAILEDHVTLGSNVDVLSGRHQHHFDDLNTPIQQQGGAYRAVRLGRNSWIGNSAVVMADVGAECVLGAGSVVVKPIPPRSVAAGNPATVKRRREPAAVPDQAPVAVGGAA